MEIVSDSSVHKDKELLPQAHFAAGTIEYWLVDARIETNIEFCIYRRDGETWLPGKPDGDGYQTSTVLASKFRLSATTDEDNWPEFSLATKPN